MLKHMRSAMLSAMLGMSEMAPASAVDTAPRISRNAMKRRRNTASVTCSTPETKPMSRQVRRFIARKGTLKQRLARGNR